MLYSFLRMLAIPIAIIGWLFFQIFIKKKHWKEVKGDVGVITFIIAVYGIVYFVLLR